MGIYEALFAAALFATGLSAGVFFTFTTMVVPGLRDANELESLKGFQTIDRRLQRTSPSTDWQPVFGVVIFGSGVLVLAALAVGFGQVSNLQRALLITATLVANLSFWLPTLTVILPFNNRVRDYDLDAMTTAELRRARAQFDVAWGRWNIVRTTGSSTAFALLIFTALAG